MLMLRMLELPLAFACLAALSVNVSLPPPLSSPAVFRMRNEEDWPGVPPEFEPAAELTGVAVQLRLFRKNVFNIGGVRLLPFIDCCSSCFLSPPFVNARLLVKLCEAPFSLFPAVPFELLIRMLFVGGSCLAARSAELADPPNVLLALFVARPFAWLVVTPS